MEKLAFDSWAFYRDKNREFIRLPIGHISD